MADVAGGPAVRRGIGPPRPRKFDGEVTGDSLSRTVDDMVHLVERHGAPDRVVAEVDRLGNLTPERTGLPAERPLTHIAHHLVDMVDRLDQAGRDAVDRGEDPGPKELYAHAAHLQQNVRASSGHPTEYNEVGCFGAERLGPTGPAGGGATYSHVKVAVAETARAFGAFGSEDTRKAAALPADVPAEVRRAVGELSSVPGVRNEGDVPVPRAVLDVVSDKAEGLEHAARDAGFAVTARQQRAVAMVYEVAALGAPEGSPAHARNAEPPLEVDPDGWLTIRDEDGACITDDVRLEGPEHQSYLEAHPTGAPDLERQHDITLPSLERLADAVASRPSLPTPPSPAAGAARDAQSPGQAHER